MKINVTAMFIIILQKNMLKKNNMQLAKKYFLKSLKHSFFKSKSLKIFIGILLIYLMPNKLNSYFKNINNY